MNNKKYIENLNSCCFVSRINSINTIKGADNIVQVTIEGWECITKKDEYKVDDLVIVATTDAVIPQKLSDDMNVTNYLRKGGRVRTVKLRGVYSECLLIPIEFAKKATGYANTKWDEGDDMMDVLKIFKYESPAKQIQLTSGKKIHYHENPNFHIYHKFPNLKNVKGMFAEEDLVEITRKIHGINARYGIVKKNKLSFFDKIKKFFKIADKWIDYEFVVGSHNVEKGSDSQGFYDTNVWYNINNLYNIKKRLWDFVKVLESTGESIGSGIILYGEIYGLGIQKNYDYGLKHLEFQAFDISINGVYQSTFRARYLIENVLLMRYVDILYFGNWSQEIQDKFTFNNFIEGTKVPHEGIVIKYVSGERTKIAKVINPDYLIYGEKHDIGDSH